jgi:rhodanese-related sulfurtransferase
MNNYQHRILNTAALLFAGIVAVVMIFQWLAGPAYKKSNKQLLHSTASNERWVLPNELNTMIENNQLDNFLLVDLRPREEFSRGTLPGAVNIPFEMLLEKKSLKQLNTRKPLILFSGSESLSSVSGMLLESKGVENVHILANNYTFVKENVLEKFSPSSAFTSDEKARYDYPRFFRAAPAQRANPVTQPQIPEVQVISIDGGC